MRSIQYVAAFILLPSWCWGVPGDLNADGIVDFDDFFLFADNFGKMGPPDTAIDTVYVERSATQDRLPEQPTWARAQQIVRPAVYWIGYTAKPTESRSMRSRL